MVFVPPLVLKDSDELAKVAEHCPYISLPKMEARNTIIVNANLLCIFMTSSSFGSDIGNQIQDCYPHP